MTRESQLERDLASRSRWLVVGGVLLAIAGASGTALGQTSAPPTASPALPAVAAPATAKQPSPSEHRRYSAALTRARTAENAGNLKLAAKGFSDCLQILADDPVALSELGAVQLRAGQLTEAEATSRKAIAHSESPTIRAAALFNLGYILARRGDHPGAIDAYQSSLRLRVNATVEAELRKLDPKAVAAVRFVPRPMRPAAADTRSMLKERCWKAVAEAWPELEATAADVRSEHFHYDCGEIPNQVALAGTRFLEVRLLISTSVYSQYPKLILSLAIRTEQGWFTAQLEQMWVNRWGDGEIKAPTLELADVGNNKAIVVHWEASWDEWPWDSDPSHAYPNGDPEGRIVSERKLAIAAIGPGGTPSMTPAISIGFSAGFGERRQPLVNGSMKLTFDPGGALTLDPPTVEPTKVPRKKFADLLDRLTPSKLDLSFP